MHKCRREEEQVQEQKEPRQRGKNVLEDEESKSVFASFAEQLNDPLIFILFAAAVISMILKEFGDMVIILAVVMLNAIVGVIQEGKAKKALEALKEMTAATSKVLRDSCVNQRGGMY